MASASGSLPMRYAAAIAAPYGVASISATYLHLQTIACRDSGAYTCTRVASEWKKQKAMPNRCLNVGC